MTTSVDLEKRPDDEPERRPEQGPPRLVDERDAPRTVDGTVISWQFLERRPVIPPWLRDGDQRRLVARLVTQRLSSSVGYHVVRLPAYALLSALYSPRGAARLIRQGFDAWFDGEGRPLRRHAVDRRDAETLLKLRADKRKHVRARTPAGVTVLLAVFILGVLVTVLPWYARWAVLAAAAAGLGRIGAPRDRPIAHRAVVLDGIARKPTSDDVTRALVACRIAGMGAKEESQIRYAHPIRVDGPGWRADIDLPLGVTATDVMERRLELASGLRRSVGCVWPEPDADAHAGRVALWIGMQDMAKARPAPYPLRKQGTADYFATLPFVTDQRGRPVGLPLAESNMLIGSLPGAGKTAAVRCVLAGCALDPTVELHIWELKGSGDLESFLRIAHDYGSGVDDDTIGQCLAGLRWLLAEVGRRAERLKTLRQRARDLVPDSKVTRELADRRGLGLHPIVFVVDECQELFSHGEHGKEAGELATAIIKRGRALGVTLVLATQRPDKDSLPTGVSANVGTRYCLRVMGQIENDMVLGTSSYKQGIRATMFTKSDRGIGYLVGATDAPVVGRTYYLDAAATDAIVARAFVARERSGLLSGQAAGEVVDHGETVDVLADVRTVFATAERIRTEDLLALLGELRPALYGGWGPEQLALALRPFGVVPGQVKIDGENRRGYRVDAVNDALARRELGGR